MGLMLKFILTEQVTSVFDITRIELLENGVRNFVNIKDMITISFGSEN